MSAMWHEEDEEYRPGAVKAGLRGKPRFSFTEVKLLLEAVKKNRYIILKKFNQGVSAEAKKQTWAEITDQINSLGENHREVRQIMKKWADLKCDGKRRAVALRNPNGGTPRKKQLGPVERMVHKILMMSPRGGGESDLDLDEDEDFSKLYSKGPLPNPPPFSYLSLTDSSQSVPGGASYEFSPMSSPEKELGGDPLQSSSDFDLADDGERTMDFEENEDSLFSSYSSSLPPTSSPSLDPLPDNALLRMKPVHTYSRNSSQTQNQTQNQNQSQNQNQNQNQNQSQNQSQSQTQNQNPNHSSSKPAAGPSSSVASTSSVFPSDSDTSSPSAAPPPSQGPTPSLPAPPSSSAPAAASQPASSSSSLPPPPAPPATSSSNFHQPPQPSSSAPPPSQPSSSDSRLSDPLPGGASFRRTQDQVAQMSSQSLQQQRASRMLLSSVSQSLEVLAQSVQLLVESQQEFVQESLLLQRETVDILRDFSNTALTMLRDKSSSGQSAHHHPAAHH